MDLMLLITLFERAYDKPGTVACTCNRSDPTGLDPADAWRVGDPPGVDVCLPSAGRPGKAAQRCIVTCAGRTVL